MDNVPCERVTEPFGHDTEAEIPSVGLGKPDRQEFDLASLSNHSTNGDNNTQALRSDDFQQLLEAQLSCLRSTLLNEHTRHVSSLEAEVHRLREALFQATDVASPKSAGSQVGDLNELAEMSLSARAEQVVGHSAVHFGMGKVENGEESHSEQSISELQPTDEVSHYHHDQHDHQESSSRKTLIALQAKKGVCVLRESVESAADPGERHSKVSTATKVSTVSSRGRHLRSLRMRSKTTELAERKTTRDRTRRLYDAHHKSGRVTFAGDGSGLSIVQQIVQSSWFEMCSGAVIMANTIIIALQMQYDGFDSGFALKVPGIHGSAKDTWPGAEVTFTICNITFNALFAIELAMRVGALKWKSVRSFWIWFDAVIVGVGVTDIVAQDALAFNPGMMRVFRLFRLVRLLKVFQAMSSFDSLFLLLKAIHASREALVWSFMILGLVQLIVGLFLCQVLQEVTADEKQPLEARQTAFKYFGTFSRTMLTMFEITMANWVVSARALIDDVSELFILFFILYRCMFCFAILRVIAAVFITETNRVLEHDDELTIMKRNREKLLFQAKLAATFKAMDPSGRGRFGWKELDALMGDPELLNLVTTLGFDVHDFEKLFWLLDDGSGEISIHEFISKMGKLKGQSKTIDMLTMLKLTHRIDQKIQTVFEKQGLLERNELEVAEEDLACRV